MRLEHRWRPRRAWSPHAMAEQVRGGDTVPSIRTVGAMRERRTLGTAGRAGRTVERRRHGAASTMLLLVTVTALLVGCTPSEPPDPATPRRWVFDHEASFSDDFDVDGALDTSRWEVLVEERHDSALTDRPSNVRVEDGNLVIEAHAEQYGSKAFTSAMIQTRRAFLHGRFEARMRVPTGAGTWPAFWLCCTGAWPDSGEIDVVEHYAGDGGLFDFHSGFAESNLHSAPNLIDSSRGRLRRTKIDPGAWHTYGVEWAPDEIRFFVDGTLTAIHRSTDPESVDGGWPFATEPERLLFDLFLGGPAGPTDPTAMPQHLLVDWVRGFDLIGPF